MSKKYLGILLAGYSFIATSTCQVKASAFNGAYVGVSTGWFHKKVNLKIPLFKDVKHPYINSMPIVGHVGYLFSSANNFLYGLETGIGYNFFGNKKTEVKHWDGAVPRRHREFRLDYRNESKVYMEFLTKFGWNFNDMYATYIILGASYQKTKHKFTVTNLHTDREIGHLNKTQNVWGFVPALGGAYKLDQNWVVRGEYKYHVQNSKKINGDHPSTKNIDIKQNMHDVRIAVDYAF